MLTMLFLIFVTPSCATQPKWRGTLNMSCSEEVGPGCLWHGAPLNPHARAFINCDKLRQGQRI